MPFDSFLGNPHCVSVLRRALRRDRLPHALLFCGPDAVGKRLLAIHLAKALNCTASDGSDWCGECKSCRLIESGNQPDIHTLQPDGQFIKIEQVRNLIQEALFQPFQSRCKVFILDDADRMQPAAANALLKILEEPPRTSRVILVTSQPHALLPTIRSRCQLLRFSPLLAEEIGRILIEKCGVDASQAADRAFRSEGSVGKAIQLNLERDAELGQWVQSFLDLALSHGSIAQATDLAALFCKERADTEDWLRHLFLALRSAMLKQVEAGTPPGTGRGWTLKQIEALSRAAGELRKGLEHNVNRPLALDRLFLQFREIAKEGPV